MGRIMTPDYVYIYEENTVSEVFDTLRKHAKNSETVDVLYVINNKGELLDDIRIRDFILADPGKKVREIMDGRFIALHVNDDQESAAESFKMNNRVALPVTDDNNILLVADEVQSGFGRTGKMFAVEHWGVRPDILVMAKGIANGFPLSGIVSRKELMDTQKPGSMGGTYAGNAVSCAAGIAVAETFDGAFCLIFTTMTKEPPG